MYSIRLCHLSLEGVVGRYTKLIYRSASMSKIGIALLLIAVLNGCGSAPGLPPGRVAFPGEQPISEPVTRPSTDNSGQEQEVFDLSVPPLFAAVEEALARHDWLAAKTALDVLQTSMKPSVVPIKVGAPMNPEATRQESTRSSPPDSPLSSKAAPVSEDRTEEETPTSTSGGPATDKTGIDAWLAFYNGLIEWERGRIDEYQRVATQLRSSSPPSAVRYRLAQKELEVASLANDSGRALAAIVDLQRYTLSEGGPSELTELFWRHLQQLSSKDLAKLRQTLPLGYQPWINLAALSRMEQPEEVLASIEAWTLQHGEHSALPIAESLRSATQADSSIERVAILAPISGPLERAGAAVSDGVFFEFYRDLKINQQQRQNRSAVAPSPRNLTFLLVDTGKADPVNVAYGEAKDWGADLIIGPLEKRRVEQLFEFQEKTPLITLNRREQPSGELESGVLQLSLAPEDEASQLAEAAFADGLRRVVLLRPEGEWGDRMEGALLSRWNTLGGRVASAGVYGAMSTYSDVLRAALDLDASGERNRSMRRLFSSRVEVEDRRRKDLDGIFMLCRNAEEARALKPLIDYHYAGDLPVYAVSTADTRSSDPNANRDLNGVRLLTMPWRVARDDFEPPGGDLSGALSPLFALGADAYHLSQHYHRSQASLMPYYSGRSAELNTQRDGVLKRRLILAEFDRGVLRRR